MDRPGQLKGEARDLAEHLRSGTLILQKEPADDEEILEEHRKTRSRVYYVDGSAKMGHGTSAVVRYEGGQAVEAKARTAQEVADAFTTEQESIWNALEDAREGSEDVVIWTDSQSNVASLLAMGPRDWREGAIIRAMVRMCRASRRVKLAFVRSHLGLQGNEAADVVSREERENQGSKLVHSSARPIARNVAVSRLGQWARGRLAKRIAKRVDVKSCAIVCVTGGLEDSPTIFNTGKITASRREEIIYNQLRTGVATFACGLRDWKAAGAQECRHCGAAYTPRHYLWCCPAGNEHRQTLSEEVHAEKCTKYEEDVEEAAWRGRVHMGKRPTKKMHMRDLGRYPQPFLDYIGKTWAWIDEGVKPSQTGAPVESKNEEGENWKTRPQTGSVSLPLPELAKLAG